MEKLAIFDVDYTLTKKETLFVFYSFMIKKKPQLVFYAPKGIINGLSYALGFTDAEKAKISFMKFIKNIHENEIQMLVKEFYQKSLSKIFYIDAINTMKRHKAEGCKIYLISASAEFYLKELYNIKEVDKIIGTKFEFEDGFYTGKVIGANNKGEEKVKRLKEVLKQENIQADFENSYMYSDSLSDLPLFKMVGHPYLINSKKKKDNIEVLHWK